MRLSEARQLVEAWARDAAHAPRRGEALLGWRARGSAATHEWRCPSRAVALRLAADLVADPTCQGVWVDDGKRRYDTVMLAGGRAMPGTRARA